MNYLLEYLLYGIVKFVGFVISQLPISFSLAIGRGLGTIGYFLDRKHRALAYANLKIAFARTKKPSKINRIVKTLFQNYGQNLMELFYLPLMRQWGPEKFIAVEGREHVLEARKKGKGVILLAMHFGSWEISSLIGAIFGCPYCVFVKPQKRFLRLDELLNSYRRRGGATVITRGRGTRQIIESLRRNEVIGTVVDQGGRDGMLVKFFGKQASLSVGAIKIGLKYDVPICFSIIIREKGCRHRLIIHPPLTLKKTEDINCDILTNLNEIEKMMERYIIEYPAEYMWFYKIWKYSKESTMVILDDDKPGHRQQSKAVAQLLEKALAGRGITPETQIVKVEFKNKWAAKAMTILSFLSHPQFCQGRIRYLKWFLTRESFQQVMSVKADYVISCGSLTAGVNFLLSRDYRAKSISILKPSIFGFRRFDLLVLPAHDARWLGEDKKKNVVVTQGALNLINEEYLKEQTNLFRKRFSYFNEAAGLKIGILLGGDTKRDAPRQDLMRAVLRDIKEAAQQLQADIFLTTSRRTPAAIEDLVQNELKSYSRCPALIIANHNNIPEAVGGILGLSDIIVTTADSISMVSESASCGKNVIVFSAQNKNSADHRKTKHGFFLETMQSQNYIVLADGHQVGPQITAMAKNKIKTKTLDNNVAVLEALKKVI